MLLSPQGNSSSDTSRLPICRNNRHTPDRCNLESLSFADRPRRPVRQDRRHAAPRTDPKIPARHRMSMASVVGINSARLNQLASGFAAILRRQPQPFRHLRRTPLRLRQIRQLKRIMVLRLCIAPLGPFPDSLKIQHQRMISQSSPFDPRRSGDNAAWANADCRAGSFRQDPH